MKVRLIGAVLAAAAFGGGFVAAVGARPETPEATPAPRTTFQSGGVQPLDEVRPAPKVVVLEVGGGLADLKPKPKTKPPRVVQQPTGTAVVTEPVSPPPPEPSESGGEEPGPPICC